MRFRGQHATLTAAVSMLGALALALAGGGCGEKIAIPQPVGLFSVAAWLEDDAFVDPDARQVAQSLAGLFVVTPDSVTKRDLEYNIVAGAGGLTDATAVCVGPNDEVVYVWDQGTHSLHWYAVSDLQELGSAPLPAVLDARQLFADPAGIEMVPGARTFLYLTDPESGVVHRYAFDDFNGPSAFGILTRSEGDGARSVHVAAGMATDAEGYLLVCDADTLRNWVIRFDGTPDLDDTTPAVDDDDPLRGRAVEFEVTCEPSAATDFVLGDAAVCGQSGWVGAPSAEAGEFDTPVAVAVDGSGRIFVADQGNNRVQVFTPGGQYFLQFGTATTCPAPSSLALVDVRVGTGVDDVNHAAYVFVVTPGTGHVRRFISNEHYIYIHREPPPVRP